MNRRAPGISLPLLDGPDAAGLALRARVYKTCLKGILEGRLARGARLPSARDLARDWNVSRNTVDDALAQLTAEAFLVRKTGDGTYVANPLPGRIASSAPVALRPPSVAGRAALDALSRWGQRAVRSHSAGAMPKHSAFLAGFPDLSLFPLELWQRLTLRAWRSRGRELLGYFPSMGYEPLREATVRHLATARGVVCAPEQVMILNSSMQGLDLIGRVLLERDDEVWVEDPGYPNTRVALSMSGAKIVNVPVDDQGLVVARGNQLAPRAALVYTSPSCQYPTGVSMSLQRRLELLQWAGQAGAWIVEDDYQSEFAYEGQHIEPLQSLDRGARVFYLGTFTNALFPSLRLAYMIVPRQMCEAFHAVRSQLDDHTHGLQQVVLADFIDGGHLSSHLRKMKPVYKARRDALLEAGRSLPRAAAFGPARFGMNVALHLPRQVSDRALCERGAEAGLRLAPLSRYNAEAGNLNGVLLGYTALSETAIRSGMRQLVNLLGRAKR